MSRNRALTVWAVLALLIFLFPHYIVRSEGGELDAGWGFVFTGPATEATNLDYWGRRESTTHLVTKKGQFSPTAATRDIKLLALMEGVVAALALAYLRFGDGIPGR